MENSSIGLAVSGTISIAAPPPPQHGGHPKFFFKMASKKIQDDVFKKILKMLTQHFLMTSSKNPRWRPPPNFKEFGKKFNDKKIQDGVRIRILGRD